MTIRIIRAFFARCLGLPIPGKIDSYFPRLEQGIIQLSSLETKAVDEAKIFNEEEDKTECSWAYSEANWAHGDVAFEDSDFEESDLEASDV